MQDKAPEVRIGEDALDAFVREVLQKLGTPAETAALAARSMLDASLLGVDTHGVEALDMYVDHLRAGGLNPKPEPVMLRGKGGLSRWDMQGGFGLAGARKLMACAVERARENGTHLVACRNTNHIGACGVYGKIAADAGMIGIVAQQTRAAFAPWGGTAPRVGTSPLAVVAPVEGAFPFYYDASFGMMTGAQIKAHIRAGTPLPEGVALDADGNPTTDPRKAWTGQVLPIGRHKGVGLAMAMEVLDGVLSGNVFSSLIPSIVSNPERNAGSSIFLLAVDPDAVMPRAEFARRMREYVEYIESSPARDPANPPRHPGRREGETWSDRRQNGIPIRPDAMERLKRIAAGLGLNTPGR